MDYIPIMQVGYSYEKLGHYLFDCSLFKLFAMAVVAKWASLIVSHFEEEMALTCKTGAYWP